MNDSSEGIQESKTEVIEPDERKAAHESATASKTLSRGTVLGRYIVLECLGEGGMGVVYGAYDPELDRKVALKLLRAEKDAASAAKKRMRLVREAQAMARLAHPHVVAVHDVGSYEDQVFLAMEFVEGATLGKWLKERKRSMGEILEMFKQAGTGLDAAHKQGLVHRDFKPDNVLIGKDGRARVLDFGLARAAGASAGAKPEEESEEKSKEQASSVEALGELFGGVNFGYKDTLPATDSGLSPTSDVFGSALTKTGTCLGTPMYMAPEQFRGQVADERADQFSFCVALYEGLYGEHPFVGESSSGLVFNVMKGNVREEPRQKPLPTSLRKAILQGLRVNKEERHASMDALLHALELKTPLWKRFWVVGALVVVLGLGAGLFWFRSQSSSVCRGAEEKLTGVWDDTRKQQIKQAFLATGKPYAKDAFDGVERELDRYAGDWVAMHTDACLATRVRGEQSEELLDLRMECLSQRFRELRAFVDVLEGGDDKVVEQSVQSAQSMTALSVCANTAALKAPVRPPSDPAVLGKLDSIRDQLARARALEQAGKYVEEATVAHAAANEAVKLNYSPIEAESLYAVGRAEMANRRYDEAQRALKDALFSAEAGRDDELTTRAWMDLVLVQSYENSFAEARESSRHAIAMNKRLEDNDERTAYLERALGILAKSEGRYDDEFVHVERSYRLYEKAYGAEHVEVASALLGLANAAYNRGKYAEAIQYYERALKAWEKLVGPDHPRVATTLTNFGDTLYDQGRLEEASKAQLRSIAIYEKAFGPDHVSLVSPLMSLGNILGDELKFDEAIAFYLRALAIKEKTKNSDISHLLSNIGATLYEQDKFKEAASYFERSIAIYEQVKGKDHPNIALFITNLGNALAKLGRPREALTQYERALDVAEKKLGPEHPYVADALVGLGKTLLQLHDNAKAISTLERALEIRTKVEEKPIYMAEARFELACTLWESGRDKKRALELAEDAKGIYRNEGAPSQRDLAEVEAWLQSHRLR